VSSATLLLVDDEPRVLLGLSAYLKSRYTVHTAESGPQGLKRLAADPSISVIVSDMRMPGMDGAQFLARARLIAPLTVRLLLTGQADIGSAIAAINEGQIFRFLTKPTAPALFLSTIEAAVAQHRLITAEKVLLEQTLRGSLRTMTEILALANPMLFGRAGRIKRVVTELAQKLGAEDHWQIEVAAMLSQIAQVSLPAEVAEKLSRAADLSPEERAMVARLPEATDQLLAHIPRLEAVRVMLANAQEPFRQSEAIQPEAETQLVTLGAKLIKAATVFDALTQSGLSSADAVGIMRAQRQRFDQQVVNALGELHAAADDRKEIIGVPVGNLLAGMVLAEDLMTRAGVLLVARGIEVTSTFLERLRNYKPGSLQDAVRVVAAGAPVEAGVVSA
jgi:response regulator RpfG family c-di-GMP phosphodiesterase